MQCVNYLLSLRPPLLRVTPELLTLLQDVLSIAEADEAVLQTKFLSGKQAAVLTRLRAACIELQCTAMAWDEFKTGAHADMRSRVIAMFFKSLTLRTPEIVGAAKEGLRQVIMQQRLPKELLQDGALCVGWQAGRQPGKQAGGQVVGQGGGHAGKRPGGQVGRQSGRQEGRQAGKHASS